MTFKLCFVGARSRYGLLPMPVWTQLSPSKTGTLIRDGIEPGTWTVKKNIFSDT